MNSASLNHSVSTGVPAVTLSSGSELSSEDSVFSSLLSSEAVEATELSAFDEAALEVSLLSLP